jgi:hypothetical protein
VSEEAEGSADDAVFLLALYPVRYSRNEFGALSITICSDYRIVKPEYTLRYRYVTGCGCARHPPAPLTRLAERLSAPGIRLQTSCDPSPGLRIVRGFHRHHPKRAGAAAVKLISVVVKRFTDVYLFIRVQLVEFLQKR